MVSPARVIPVGKIGAMKKPAPMVPIQSNASDLGTSTIVKTKVNAPTRPHVISVDDFNRVDKGIESNLPAVKESQNEELRYAAVTGSANFSVVV